MDIFRILHPTAEVVPAVFLGSEVIFVKSDLH